MSRVKVSFWKKISTSNNWKWLFNLLFGMKPLMINKGGWYSLVPIAFLEKQTPVINHLWLYSKSKIKKWHFQSLEVIIFHKKNLVLGYGCVCLWITDREELIAFYPLQAADWDLVRVVAWSALHTDISTLVFDTALQIDSFFTSSGNLSLRRFHWHVSGEKVSL